MIDEPVYYHFEIDGQRYTVKEWIAKLVFNPSGVQRLTVDGRFSASEKSDGNGKQ